MENKTCAVDLLVDAICKIFHCNSALVYPMVKELEVKILQEYGVLDFVELLNYRYMQGYEKGLNDERADSNSRARWLDETGR